MFWWDLTFFFFGGAKMYNKYSRKA